MNGVKLRRIATSANGTGFPHSYQGKASGDLPFFKVSDFNLPGNERYLNRCTNWITRSEAVELNARVVPSKSILLPKVGAALLGNARRITTCPSVFDNNVLAIVPKVGDSRYLHYWMTTLDAGELSYPGPVPSLTGSEFLDLLVPVESVLQQQAIADFLEVETARIDALIEKKRRLATLLLTRVESLVSDRLQRIEHQRGFVPLKSVANVRVSNVDKKTVEGEQRVRLCNYTDVYYSRKIDPKADFMAVSANHEQIRDFSLRSGDVLITKDSETADDIGVPAYVPEDMSGVVLGYHTALIRSYRMDGHYLYWVLRSRRSRDHFTVSASGVTRFGLRQGDIGSLPVPAASASDQMSISREIEDSVTSGERTMAALERQIQLLAEHRQALITAAVTGELEVPGAEIPR